MLVLLICFALKSATSTLQHSLCNVTQFACSLSGPCIPLAYLCNGIRDCPNGQDEARCDSIEVVKMSTNISVDIGEDVTLGCEATGYPPPFITWLRDFEPLYHNPRYSLKSYYGYGMLTVREAQASDAGLYSCVVITGLHGSTVVQPAISLTVNNPNPTSCEDRFQQAYIEGSYFYNIEAVVTGPAAQAAADIVFVVDESGSMALEHEWIQRVVVILEQSLKQHGVGVGERENLYALVGFGRNDPSAVLGVTLTPLTSLVEFLNTTEQLVLDGNFEDGYAAISHALEAIEARRNTAKQIIFISDEERGILRADLSFDSLSQQLKDSGFILNVAVNQGFLSSKNDPLFALGLRGDGQSFIFNQSSSVLFSTTGGGLRSPPEYFDFGSTYEDYVELSFTTQGVAWDLNQLREGGDYSIAFTNAFTQVKIDEVMSVFSFCLICLCMHPKEICTLKSDIELEDCVGEYTAIHVVVSPDKILVASGNSATFECLTFASNLNISLGVTWEYPAGADIVVDGAKLIIVNASASSEGEYKCIVHSSLKRTVTAVGALRIDTRCNLPDGSFLVLDDRRYILLPVNATRAADIILLVDESGSMTMKHQWIPEMVKQLDNALMETGIGVHTRNRFGVIGFGGDCTIKDGLGRILQTNESDKYVVSDNILELTKTLRIGGKQEDGYSAIATALKEYTFQDGAKQFILITDEDRDVLVDVTRNEVESMLKANDVILNTVVSQEFTAGGIRSFGVDRDSAVYIYDPSVDSFFKTIHNVGAPIEDSAYGSTDKDYTQLAFLVKGGSWDLSLLQQGGQVARAFTNSFVHAKVVEIQHQLEECFQCFCKAGGPICELVSDGNNLPFCSHMPVSPHPAESPLEVNVDIDFVRIKSQENYTVMCHVNTSARVGWTFNGGALPANTFQKGHHGLHSSLTINFASEKNSGQYVCLASSPGGSYSGIDLVHVEVDDPFQYHLFLSPIEATFIKATNNSISCNVTDAAYFSWKFNDGPLPSNAVIYNTSPTSSLLTLYVVDEANMGGFTCSANISTTGMVVEDTAIITISEIRLRLSVNPQFVETNIGTRIEISCALDCNCQDLTISPVWVSDDHEGTLPIGTTVLSSDSEMNHPVTSMLVIGNASLETAGKYICFARFDSVIVEQDIYVAINSVNNTPSVNIIGASNVSVPEGSNYSLVCEATVNASITWFFNGLQIGDRSDEIDPYVSFNTEVVQLSQQRSLLSIISFTSENAGTYKCRGSSNQGTMSFDSVAISIDVPSKT